MNPIALRAAHIAVELRALQKQLSSEAGNRPERLVEDLATFDLIRELKSAVDSMRLLLWNYIDQHASAGAGTANSQRLNEATAMLRSLRSDTFSPPAAATFFETINEIVDRHSPTAAPSAA